MNPLLDESNFVPGDIQEREVVLGDGKKHLLKFKRVTGVEQYSFAMTQRMGDDESKVRSIARLISACVVDGEGKPALTVEQAMGLKEEVLNNLLAAAYEVNRSVAGKKASKPEAKDTSGT